MEKSPQSPVRPRVCSGQDARSCVQQDLYYMGPRDARAETKGNGLGRTTRSVKVSE